MVELQIGSTRRLHCNTCKIETHHELKAIHTRSIPHLAYEGTPNEQLAYWEEFQYRFWVCRGCDTASMEEAYSNSGMFDENDNQVWDSTLYPSRRKMELPLKMFRRLSKKLSDLYREVVMGTNAGLRITPAVGLRSLLEGICAEKGITDEIAWGLEAKLKRLEEDKHLPPNIVKGLISFKFIGDDAAHRLKAPTEEELKLAVEVMEDLLNLLYEIEYSLTSKAKRLANGRSAEMAELETKRGSKAPS